MKELLKNLIIKGEFLETRKYLEALDADALQSVVFALGFDEQSICAYSFICFLIGQNETVERHLLAMELLVHCFPHIQGAYASALYHVRKAIELRPDDIDLEELLLFMHELPLIDKLIKDNEAKEIAEKVLKKNHKALELKAYSLEIKRY